MRQTMAVGLVAGLALLAAPAGAAPADRAAGAGKEEAVTTTERAVFALG